MNNKTIVIGGDGAVGEILASQLESNSATVVLLDAVEHATAVDTDTQMADPSEAATLDPKDIEETSIAIVASQTDSHNLLVALLLQHRQTERVIALVNDPANVEAFAEAGIEPVCASIALASALAQRHGVEDERSSGKETEDSPERRLEREESTDSPERERLRNGAGGDT